MHNILLIGDKVAVAQYARGLADAGFFVTVAAGSDDDVPEGDFGAVVVDIASSAEDALARRFLENARAGEAVPVIGIVGPDQLPGIDPAHNLEDFLLAGALPAELSARVHQALWKRHRVDARNTIRCGELVMDLSNYTVHVAGRPVDLTYKEYELLRFLATNRDRVVNRETLLNKVWGYDFYGGARTVDVHIRRLRSKIEDRHHMFIETVRNVGYRFRPAP